MKILAIIIAFFGYGLFVAAYEGNTGNAPDFPVFDSPNVNFEEIPDSCGGFTDCIEYVGKVIVNMVLGVVFFVLLIVAILIFLVAFFAIVAESAFTGVDGAPWWVNALVIGIFAAAIAIIFFKSIRKGDTTA